MRPLLLVRWSGRDLRHKWLQVAAIALIIAIGTGVFAALGSAATWRRQSNDASYELTAMYDLRVRAAAGADTRTGDMIAALATLPDPGGVEVAEERLILPTQVDASTEDQTILVPGRLIGVDVNQGGPHVNRVVVADGEGRELSDQDSGEAVAVLERSFAKFYNLPTSGTVRIAGGSALHYVGRGLSPEYFFIVTDDGAFFAEANFAALFAPLETVQSLTGRMDRVNDLVIRLRPGIDPTAFAADIKAAFAGSNLGVTVMQTKDEESYRILYQDIEGDQRIWNVFAGLILIGAAFGAFNLIGRMVEAQRREIGIGMALGMSPPSLALRPLLVGAQIATLGAVFGVGVGLLATLALRPVYTTLLPLPVWHTDLQLSAFLRGAALGVVTPLVATIWPVWRAVRVTPVEAISVTHRSSRGGLAPLLRRLRWPVSALRRMPLGNVLRTPRRTMLTALGIGAAISCLVAILGMLDSFIGTMERNDRELLGDHPDRVSVSLDRFVATDGPEVAAVAEAGSVGSVEPLIRLGARLGAAGAADLDVLLEVINLQSDVWGPSIVRGAVGDGTGLVIAEKAAADLGVAPGDEVVLEHPARQGSGFAMLRTPIRVAAIHPSPFRFAVYLDRSQLAPFGMERLANQLYVVPAPGSSPDDVKRDLFELDAVASVLPIAAATQILKDSLQDFTAGFQVLELFILGLALLIAYNTTSINADERARERATLFAFGLPTRRVIRLETVEGIIHGMAGTAVGIGVGILVLRWVVTSIAASTMPDLSVDVIVSGSTLLTAAVLGVVAVAIAPLLTLRRLRRMNIPGMLRTVE